MIPTPERVTRMAGRWWVWVCVTDGDGRRRLRPRIVEGAT